MATATTTTRAASTFAVFDAACDPAGHVQVEQHAALLNETTPNAALTAFFKESRDYGHGWTSAISGVMVGNHSEIIQAEGALVEARSAFCRAQLASTEGPEAVAASLAEKRFHALRAASPARQKALQDPRVTAREADDLAARSEPAFEAAWHAMLAAQEAHRTVRGRFLYSTAPDLQEVREAAKGALDAARWRARCEVDEAAMLASFIAAVRGGEDAYTTWAAAVTAVLFDDSGTGPVGRPPLPWGEQLATATDSGRTRWAILADGSIHQEVTRRSRDVVVAVATTTRNAAGDLVAAHVPALAVEEDAWAPTSDTVAVREARLVGGLWTFGPARRVDRWLAAFGRHVPFAASDAINAYEAKAQAAKARADKRRAAARERAETEAAIASVLRRRVRA